MIGLSGGTGADIMADKPDDGLPRPLPSEEETVRANSSSRASLVS
jgi:hypothetical protein